MQQRRVNRDRRSVGSADDVVPFVVEDRSSIATSKKPDVETMNQQRWSNPTPKTFQPEGDVDYDNLKKPSSPTFFPIDGFTSAAAFRPHVFKGPSDPSAGILGFQARSADGLDENFTIAEPSNVSQQLQPQLLPPTPSVDLQKHYFPFPKTSPLPHLPAEIHLQILSGILDDHDVESDNCSFCHLFRLSALSRVSPFYRTVAQSALFTTLDLTCNTGSCKEHFRLSSPHQQLSLRLPKLLQTLAASPELAAQIRTIALPSSPFLNCEIEKTLLPLLIQSAPNVTRITGLGGLLNRQFFSGEHYCLDGEDPQQHGIIAKTLTTTSTLTSWAWNGGNAAGRDFEARLWDHNPKMEGMGFVKFHRHWSRIREFALCDVWGVDPGMLADLLSGFPALEKVELVKVRRRRVGDTDPEVVLAGLEAVWMGLKEVVIGEVKDGGFVDTFTEWVQQRGVTSVALRGVKNAERVFDVCGGVLEEVEIEGEWDEEDVDMDAGAGAVTLRKGESGARRRRMWRRERSGWREIREVS